MKIQNRKNLRGFTLIEIMITVAIIGILSSMAIPAFSKYVRRSRTTEALMNLRKLYDGSVTYFTRSQINRAGNAIPRQFPGRGAAGNPRIALTPAPPFCEGGRSKGGKWIPQESYWDVEGWNALMFAVADPHYYSYEYVSDGTMSQSSFTARANGDLNCNGNPSTFERTGRVDDSLNVIGAAGVYTVLPLE